MLAIEFARFLGLPVPPRANMTNVIEAVCGVAIDAPRHPGLVDEIHNLHLATRSGAEVSDTLKYFSERLPATFVFSELNDFIHFVGFCIRLVDSVGWAGGIGRHA